MSKRKTDLQLAGNLLFSGNGNSRFSVSLLALWAGCLLLMIAVTIWWNFHTLINKSASHNVSTFLVVSKKITNETMGRPGSTVFTESEIQQFAHAPQVMEIGEIASNHFPVYAVIGGQVAFSTDLPLESIDEKFMDTVPGDWHWQPGSRVLPVIMSTQFLDIYNYVFAPSQGLPQLSQSSVKSVGISIKAGNETFLAHVTGFSDRINSILVPREFMDYGNSRYAISGSFKAPSRIIAKVGDPNDKGFANYLNEHNYYSSDQSMRWNRIRAVVEVVVSSVGVLALIILGISTLVMVLFIELTVSRARQSITLLLDLGYSPTMLGLLLHKRFVPRISSTMLSALILILVLQFGLSKSVTDYGLSLPAVPGFAVWLTFGVNLALVALTVTLSIRKTLKKAV